MDGTALFRKIAVSHSELARPNLFWFIILSVVISVAACSSDSSSGDGFTTYDDFTGTTISTTKWTQDDVDARGTVSIVNNAFRAELNADGSFLNNNARLEMTDAGNPGSVTGLEVTINVSEVTQTSGGIGARLSGIFYNDGTLLGAGAGSSISDIFAVVEIEGSASTTTGNTDVFVGRCTNSDCSTGVGIFAGGTFGTVQLSEDHTFRMEFDSTTSTFTITVDGGSTITIEAAALGAAFSAGAKNPSVKVGVRGHSSPLGTMTATFDDFRCKGCTLP